MALEKTAGRGTFFRVGDLKLPPPPKILRRFQKKLKISSLLARDIKMCAKIIQKFYTVSDRVSRAVKFTKLPTIMGAPFAVHGAVSEFLGILSEKKPLVERVKSAFTFVVHIDAIADAVSSTMEILNAFKVIADKTVDWVPIFNIVSFVIGFISIGLSGETTFRAQDLYRSLNKTSRKLEDATNDDERFDILIESLDELLEKGIKPLRKRLMLSKAAGIEIEERVSTLAKIRLPKTQMTPEQKKKAVAKGVDLMAKLKGRAKVHLKFSVAELSNRVAGTVGAGLATFSPVPVAGYILIACSSASALVCIGSKFLFVNKNPFDPTSKSRAKALLDKASHCFSRMREQLKSLRATRALTRPT